MRRNKSVFSIIFLIATLEGTIIATSALPPVSLIIGSQGTIRYPFVGNPWEIRCFTSFPYAYHYSEIGTGSRWDFENLLIKLIERFGDPTNGGAVNTIDVRLYYTMDPARNPNASLNDPKIYEGPDMEENTIEYVGNAIDLIHSYGFKVLLGFIKVWGEPDIPDADAEQWLINFKDEVVTIAQFAEAHNVELFHMDWEYVLHNRQLQDGSLDHLWKDIIQAVRAVYSGLLSAETNYWPYDYWWGEEGSSKIWVDDTRTWENTWWRDLDYIAISTYPILIPQDSNRERDPGEESEWDPTVDRLVNEWLNSTEYGFNWFEAYQDLANHYGKKLLLNVGYPSCDGAAMRPWFPYTDRLDWQEQADLWEAFFRVWSQADFLLGADLEHFTKPDAVPIYPEDGWQYQYRSNFADKDAEAVIKNGFLSVMGG